MSNDVATQIGRVADALFQQAKQQKRAVDIQQQMLEAQKANLSATKALEEMLRQQFSG